MIGMNRRKRISVRSRFAALLLGANILLSGGLLLSPAYAEGVQEMNDTGEIAVTYQVADNTPKKVTVPRDVKPVDDKSDDIGGKSARPVRTGDDTRLMLYAALTVVSASFVVISAAEMQADNDRLLIQVLNGTAEKGKKQIKTD